MGNESSLLRFVRNLFQNQFSYAAYDEPEDDARLRGRHKSETQLSAVHTRHDQRHMGASTWVPGSRRESMWRTSLQTQCEKKCFIIFNKKHNMKLITET